ncbi:MAG: LuxR C-terminal-related transcriptional regulator [Chloroflexi bacterium]|nr:LuxR C-terminal-related transcriptional regulator [Chloroflexota bacterium]MDA1147363.1 LuxR C-terminal-related transcriptional regulator [Chloroflexota bacterium]
MSGSPGSASDQPRMQRATTRDGVGIAYAEFQGEPPVFLSVSTPGAPPLPLRLSMPLHGAAFAQFRRGRAGAFFDWRGAGASDPVDGPIDINELVADLEAVTGALPGPVDAIAWGRACFAVCLHAAEMPDRYRSLRIDGGALRAGENWQGLYNRPGWEPYYSEHLQGLARHYFGAAPDEAMSLALRWERGVPASVFAAYLASEQQLDLTEVLPRIEVPTWVTARNPVDYEPAATIAALLPNSILSIYEAQPPRRGAFGDFGRDEWDRTLGAALGDPPSAPVASAASSDRESGGAFGISKREHEVLGLVATGATNRQIGNELEIAEGTVKRHVSHLLQKTGLQNRRQLMRFADDYKPPS